MPRISVVLPVFNGAASLDRTLASILGQSETDFELIAVDDGSTDASLRILESHAASDGRIRLVAQQNSGVTRALIRGCQAATAPVIARHDCGDTSDPERFRRQLQVLDSHPDVVLVSCAVDFRGPGGERLYVVRADGEHVRQSLRHDAAPAISGLPHHGSAMFRRDAYERAGGYRPEFYFAQDLDLWIRMATLGRIEILPDLLYVAAIAVGTISAGFRDEQVELLGIAAAIRDGGGEALLARAASIRPRERRASAAIDARALYFIASCLRKERNPAWRRYARQAIARNPLLLRAWALFLRPQS